MLILKIQPTERDVKKYSDKRVETRKGILKEFK